MGSQLVLFCRGFSTPQIFVFVFITIFNWAFPSISSVIVLLTFAQSYVVVVFSERIPYPSLYFTYFSKLCSGCVWGKGSLSFFIFYLFRDNKMSIFYPKRRGKKEKKEEVNKERRIEERRFFFSFLFLFFIFLRQI